MKFLHVLSGIAILLWPSSTALMVASPMVRVPLGLHMTLSPVNSLKFHRNKALKVPGRTVGPLKRKTRRNMSDSASEAAPEEQTGFWNKVSATLIVFVADKWSVAADPITPSILIDQGSCTTS